MNFVNRRHYDRLTPPPTRSSLPATDIPRFFDGVEKALALHIKSDGTPDGVSPQFEHSFPQERLSKADDPFDIITFRVLNSSMAPTLNDGSTPRSPKQRQSTPHPELAGYNLAIWGWWEMVTVEFSVWSKSNARADILTDWFHKFIMKYATVLNFFMARGVSNFKFVSRGDDDFDPVERQEIYRRRLRYEFRLEYLVPLMEKTIQSVDINVGINKNQIDTIEITE
jgi:hypothetical protein